MKSGQRHTSGWRCRLRSLASCLLLLCSALFLSCEYKELCYDHNHWATVKVTFDWEFAPEALTRADNAPAASLGMTVLFYNMETPGAEPIRYDYGPEGGTARLDPGTWRAVCYNYNTETILYRGMDYWDRLEAFTRYSSIEEGTGLTRSGMPRARGTENEPVILEPDPLWGCASEPFELEANDRDVELVLKPAHRFITITVNILNVPNLKYTGQFSGAMSGLAPSRWIASGGVGDGLVTEAFTGKVTGESSLQMVFRIFGHCPQLEEGEENTHLFTCYAILADESKWYYTVDVTNLIHKATHGDADEDITIEIDGLPVPKPIVNGSGFQPTVDSWQGVEIDVGM